VVAANVFHSKKYHVVIGVVEKTYTKLTNDRSEETKAAIYLTTRLFQLLVRLQHRRWESKSRLNCSKPFKSIEAIVK
jgi:hypothetical protein